jgi:hypothetical protein
MTKTKTLSAALILFAAVATPVFAQDAGMLGPIHQSRAYDRSNFRGAYNQFTGNSDATPPTRDEFRNVEDFRLGSRDRTWCSWADCIPPWQRSANGG